MTSKNDDVVIKLKDEIARRKAEIGKNPKFEPVTNCSCQIGGAIININTLDLRGAMFFASQMQAIYLAGKDLGYEPSVSGFTVKQWVQDAVARVRVMEHRTLVEELVEYEKKLETLLSQEKKTELELEEISKSLGL